MSPLFSVTTTYTPEMYRKMLEFDFDIKLKKKLIFIYVMCGICLLLSIALFFLSGLTNEVILIVLFTFICSVFAALLKKLTVSNMIKNTLRSDSLFFSQSFTAQFFEEYFEDKSVQSAMLIYYPQLFEAYESRDVFYLYLSKYKAVILPKASFTLGMPEAFSLFLQNKLGKRFKGSVT